MRVFGNEVLGAIHAGAGMVPPKVGAAPCHDVGLALADLAVERGVRFAKEFADAMRSGDVDADEARSTAWAIMRTAGGSRAEQSAIVDRMYALIKHHGENPSLEKERQPVASSRIDWSTVPLGSKSDRDIAAEIGVSRTTVQVARRALGIPAFREKRRIDWDSQPLGLVDDAKLAGRLGVSPKTVAEQRYRRGIKAWSRTRIDWESLPLGKVPDTWIADDIGVSKSTVKNARNRLGIAPYREAVTVDGIDLEPLGRESDHSIARRLGVSPGRVRVARLELHIPSASAAVA